MIYLDNSATTRPFDSVIDAMDRCMRENYFNASAAYKPAVDVDRAMRECRRAIAAQLGIQESGVIFTGCSMALQTKFALWRSVSATPRIARLSLSVPPPVKITPLS